MPNRANGLAGSPLVFSIFLLSCSLPSEAQPLCPSADDDYSERVIISTPGVSQVKVPQGAKYAYVIGIAGGGGGGNSRVNGADGESTAVDGIVIARGAPGASGLRLEGQAHTVSSGGVGSQATIAEGASNPPVRSAESGASADSESSPLAVAGISSPRIIPGGQAVVDPEPYRRGDGGGGGASSCGPGGNGGSVAFPAGQPASSGAYGAGGGGGYASLPHEGGSGGFGSVAQAQLLDLTGKHQLLVKVGHGGRGAPEISHEIAASGKGADGYAVIIFLAGPVDAGHNAVVPLHAQDGN